jgi:hypothetical protein
MLNRVFGVLFTLVALAIITLAAYNFGNYLSMFFDKENTAESPDSEYTIEESYEATVFEGQGATADKAVAVDSLITEELPVVVE